MLTLIITVKLYFATYISRVNSGALDQPRGLGKGIQDADKRFSGKKWVVYNREEERKRSEACIERKKLDIH